MFPGMPNINPGQMKGMMKQLGIKSEELETKKVIIELENGKKLVFEKPNVTLIDMKGNKTYTIAGEAMEEEGETSERAGITEEDIALVREQTHISEEEAKKALEESEGNIAEAISKLKK